MFEDFLNPNLDKLSGRTVCRNPVQDFTAVSCCAGELFAFAAHLFLDYRGMLHRKPNAQQKQQTKQTISTNQKEHC